MVKLSGDLANAVSGRPSKLKPYSQSGIHYVHTDHLATPPLLSNTNGDIVWDWISDAFGNTQPNEDSDGDGTLITFNPRFPGQYYDAEYGLHDNWHRYYDPSLGHYITSDPIGLEGGINTYGYALQNPLKYYDPDGRFAFLAFIPVLGGSVATTTAGGIGFWGTGAILGGAVASIPGDSSAAMSGLGNALQDDTYEQKCDDEESDRCKSLRREIENLKREIFDKRIPDLENNPGNLPEYISPGEMLRDTVRGHRKLLDRQLRRLRELEARYSKECLKK